MNKLTIDVNGGNCTIDADGFVGKKCVKETDELIKFLESVGVSVNDSDKEVRLKSRYYEREEERIRS